MSISSDFVFIHVQAYHISTVTCYKPFLCQHCVPSSAPVSNVEAPRIIQWATINHFH